MIIIFEQGLDTLLHPEEAVEADRGMGGGDTRLKHPSMGMTGSGERKMKSNTHAQQEAVNSRLKQFNVLTTHFRHMKLHREAMMEKHGHCFYDVTVIKQLKILSGALVFAKGLNYNAHYFY